MWSSIRFKYVICSIGTSVLLYYYFAIFEEVIVLLSIIPVILYALIYRAEYGKYPSVRSTIENIVIALVIAVIGSIRYPDVTLIALFGFSLTGLFILLHKLVAKIKL